MITIQFIYKTNHFALFFFPPVPSDFPPFRLPPAILFCGLNLPFPPFLLPKIFLLNPVIHLFLFSSQANCFWLELSVFETAWLEPCRLFVAVSSRRVENCSADAKSEPRSSLPVNNVYENIISFMTINFSLM